MKQLNRFIQEKLRIDKNIKSEELRNVSNCSYANAEMKLSFSSAKEEERYNKLIKEKKSKNDFNSLKNTKVYHDLLMYWYTSITNGWLRGALEFKEEIIKRSYFDEDELDAYLLSRYKRFKGFTEIERNMEEYLDANNIKYDKNERD